MTARARGLGAFSGGLDGIVAAVLLQEQGVGIELATFSSPFFGADSGRAAASMLRAPWREIDFSLDILALLVNPPSGFGSNLNPCIDCHAAMLSRLRCVMESEGFDFVFTGEVLGQRPMSQNRQSLDRVARLSGLGDRLLRPLSALALPPTRPESGGLVAREKLLGITGRGRKPQMTFARERGLTFPAPGGGCLLTDPGFSLRLSQLLSTGLLSACSSRLIGIGRMLRLGPASFGIIGRSEAENVTLESLASGMAIVRLSDRPGPSAVLVGDEAGLPLLAGLVAFYGRAEPGAPARVEIRPGAFLEVLPATREVADALLIRLPEPQAT
jgi:tRNA-specific 2-thiouridylase